MANDIIDINVYETVETVDITVQPNLTTVNINSVTGGGAVSSVNGLTGDVIIAVSENSYTTAEKNKLAGIQAGAEVNVNADWNATSGDAQILNKPTIPSISGFVPYTGATSDLDLGTYNLNVDHISLNVSPSGAGFVVGATEWNNTLGSSQTLLKGGAVILKNGVDLVARVVNKVIPNTTLTKANYQVVKVSGASGQRLAIDLAQANTDLNSADTLGIVIETIATNQEGFILTVGQIEDINTTGSLQAETWVDGDVLYLSPTTAGKITNIKPTGATGHIVILGYVEYSHASQGKIYIKIMNGWELDELHNVYITSVANKQLLSYDSATSLWKNKSVTTADISDSTGKRYQTENQNLFNDATSSIQTQLNTVKKRTAVFNNRSAWTFPANVSPNPFLLVGSTNYELATANVSSGTDVALTALGTATLLPIGIAPYNCIIKSFVIESRVNSLSYFAFPLRVVIGSNIIPQSTSITVTNVQVCEDFQVLTTGITPGGTIYNFKDTTGGVTIPKGHGIIPLIAFQRSGWSGGVLSTFIIQIEIEEVI